VLESPRGSGGFGYDPLVWLPSFGKTVAELDPATKNRLSHRADAARRMLALMREAWGLQRVVASSASGR
jgi:XTP/dITP diphosphohydrolase